MIDGFKPPAPGPAPVARSVPAQQARAGWNGFDGGSYFERGPAAAAAPGQGRHMLESPATIGPRSTPAEALAQTLETFKQLADAGDIALPRRRTATP